MRIRTMTMAIASAATLGLAAPAAAQTLPSLVNVNLQNVLNDLAIRLNIDRTNIPVTAQVPIQIAANVCGVNILSFSSGNTTCTANTAPQELVQVVQQQMVAGGGSTGGTGGGGGTGTGGTGGTGGSGTGGTGGSGGTGGTGGTGGSGGTGGTGGNTGGGGGSAETYRNHGQCQSTLMHQRNAARRAGTAFSMSCKSKMVNGRRVWVIQ